MSRYVLKSYMHICSPKDMKNNIYNWGLYFHLTNHLHLVIAYQKEIWRIGHASYTER